MEYKIGLIVRNKKKSLPYLAALSSVELLPVPIRIPSPVYADDFDGVILMGGRDIDPALYGQARGEFTEPPDRQRDEFEIGFAIQALESKLPMLAICRGMQLINVAQGGSLIQHLPRAQAEKDKEKRRASLLPDTPGIFLKSIMQNIIPDGVLEINPRHHQGIGDLGEDLVPTSRADDHVIESFELKGHPAFLGIGWHPEDRAVGNSPYKPDRALFQWLADMVRGRAASAAAH
jgi:gamma-glutamyl-gamma-aminobutyrate hydrolase PuuD